jgi:hypothetical protein
MRWVKCEMLIPSRCLPLCPEPGHLLDEVGTSRLCHEQMLRRPAPSGLRRGAIR